MQGNKRRRGEMRTRQEARQMMARWQQPARDVHKKKILFIAAVGEQVFEFVFWALMQFCQDILGIVNLKHR